MKQLNMSTSMVVAQAYAGRCSSIRCQLNFNLGNSVKATYQKEIQHDKGQGKIDIWQEEKLI
jgi:hypothetical protein